ncbi:MAG: hypothetical protein O3A46_05440 [Candidatus Poribacteria bacterium]|nr:hypothetical protein [Candidatus Poribacteria bacterium]
MDATKTRDHLHELIDVLPEDELKAAQRFLEFLSGLDTHPAILAFENASIEEPESDEIELIERSRREDERGETEWVSHEDAERILLGDER